MTDRQTPHDGIGCAYAYYCRQKSSDFDEIGYTNAHLDLDDSQMTKYEHFSIFKMANGRHFKNRFWP